MVNCVGAFDAANIDSMGPESGDVAATVAAASGSIDACDPDRHTRTSSSAFLARRASNSERRLSTPKVDVGTAGAAGRTGTP